MLQEWAAPECKGCSPRVALFFHLHGAVKEMFMHMSCFPQRHVITMRSPPIRVGKSAFILEWFRFLLGNRHGKGLKQPHLHVNVFFRSLVAGISTGQYT